MAFNKVFNERKSACLVSILLVADEFRLAAVEIDIIQDARKHYRRSATRQLMEFP